MPAEIKLEIKIDGNAKDLNKCHPYCDFIGTLPGGVMCRLFKVVLLPDFSEHAIMFHRCDKCIAAQVEVHAWKEE